jgi:transposase-like protein
LWFRRLKEALPKLERKYRKCVAVDETKLKLNGRQLFVWAAVDVKTKEVLACRISWQRNIMQAEAFLRRVLEVCSNNPSS